MILLVTGAPALADTAAAETWARAILEVTIGPEGPGLNRVERLITGGCPKGPDRWAEELAERLSVPWVSYALDGYRYSTGGVQESRWRKADGPVTDPHERNRFMLDGLLSLQKRGKRVNVCALLASWSKTNGAKRTAEWARALGLPLSFHELCSPDWDGQRDVSRCRCGHSWDEHLPEVGKSGGCGHVDIDENGNDVVCECIRPRPEKGR